jgi:glycosyltransferase 2 family protein
MPDVTSFIARSIQKSAHAAAQSAAPGSAAARNGLSRIGIAVSVLVVAAAGIVLYHILRDIDLSLVGRAIRATPVHDVALAACFVGLGYVTLTFYDFFSLRTIGRHHVPYRIAAMASFTSYSIGHNLGATVFTAGAVRWRIYSAWDLTLVDVAKMAFVTGLTFWLGNIVVLGFCMLLVPEAAGAVDQLPPRANQALGAFGLAVIAGYIFWISQGERVIGRNSWAIVLPNARLTLLQIGIGVLDLGVGGLAIYVLLPDMPPIDYITVLVIYVTAILLGFLSHAPGSLGVFEAAVLIALPQFAKEELLASLLIFRCLYFVLPLFLAVSIMAAREMWLASRQ